MKDGEGGKARENPMDPYFAVFNNHCNNAGERAKAALRRMKADKAVEEIEVAEAKGIMSIFDGEPTFATAAYSALVAHFVNGEDHE